MKTDICAVRKRYGTKCSICLLKRKVSNTNAKPNSFLLFREKRKERDVLYKRELFFILDLSCKGVWRRERGGVGLGGGALLLMNRNMRKKAGQGETKMFAFSR